MASTCLFCRIVVGEIPAKKAYEDDELLAFHDIDPKAPVHVLVIPKRHIASQAHVCDADTALMGKMVCVVAGIAKELGLEGGFRTVMNTGPDGGQTVDHLHMHLLGGRAMHWPPG